MGYFQMPEDPFRTVVFEGDKTLIEAWKMMFEEAFDVEAAPLISPSRGLPPGLTEEDEMDAAFGARIRRKLEVLPPLGVIVRKPAIADALLVALASVPLANEPEPAPSMG